MKVAIAGLGLIGGSFAKTIKARTAHGVTGFDSSEAVGCAALAAGAIDSFGEAGFAEADIVLVALYPHASVEFIRAHASAFKRGALVIDLCGVKRRVCDRVAPLLSGSGVAFIGGHPMAGRESGGFAHSLPTLFDNASMILTPQGDLPAETVRAAGGFFLSLGFGRITLTTPARHDEMIALTSQLAHVVSSAYAQNPLARDFSGFSAGSFGDMTRVAKLNEDMWTELFLSNGDFLIKQIDVILKNLEDFRKYIAEGDEEGLREKLKQGRLIKEALNVP
ncbi:MAG: prephenate dehydrogenase [Clostridiales Family XIII bacterium]|jgi:prephenate dehydrogenase|nr:prephenate dehydrogenase [Clostridiales Family XIII bacterium]